MDNLTIEYVDIKTVKPYHRNARLQTRTSTYERWQKRQQAKIDEFHFGSWKGR